MQNQRVPTLNLKTLKNIIFSLQILLCIYVFQNIHAAEFAPNIKHGHSTGDDNFLVSWINMDEHDGYILDVPPIAVFVVTTKQKCAIRCTLMSDICTSTNLITNTDNFYCEILDTDKYRNHANFKEQANSTHYPI